MSLALAMEADSGPSLTHVCSKGSLTGANPPSRKRASKPDGTAPKQRKRGGLLAAMQRYVAVRPSDPEIKQLLPSIKVEGLPQRPPEASPGVAATASTSTTITTGNAATATRAPAAAKAVRPARQACRALLQPGPLPSAGAPCPSEQLSDQSEQHVLPLVLPSLSQPNLYLQQQEQQQLMASGPHLHPYLAGRASLMAAAVAAEAAPCWHPAAAAAAAGLHPALATPAGDAPKAPAVRKAAKQRQPRAGGASAAPPAAATEASAACQLLPAQQQQQVWQHLSGASLAAHGGHLGSSCAPAQQQPSSQPAPDASTSDCTAWQQQAAAQAAAPSARCSLRAGSARSSRTLCLYPELPSDAEDMDSVVGAAQSGYQQQQEWGLAGTAVPKRQAGTRRGGASSRPGRRGGRQRQADPHNHLQQLQQQLHHAHQHMVASGAGMVLLSQLHSTAGSGGVAVQQPRCQPQLLEQRQLTLEQQQLAQQALQQLEQTPEVLLLGAASADGGDTAGSTPMLTPLALLLMEQGDGGSGGVAAAAAAASVSGGWVPLLHPSVPPAAGESAGHSLAAAGGLPAELAALMEDGEAAFEEMLQQQGGDFSIEALLGSVPAIPALGPASVPGPGRLDADPAVASPGATAAPGSGSPVISLPLAASYHLPGRSAAAPPPHAPLAAAALPLPLPPAQLHLAAAPAGRPNSASPMPLAAALSLSLCAAAASTVVSNSMPPPPEDGGMQTPSKRAADRPLQPGQLPLHPVLQLAEGTAPLLPPSPPLAACMGAGGATTSGASHAGSGLPSPLRSLLSPTALAEWLSG